MDGWFAVKRGITSHPLFKGQPERLAVWMWLLDNVAWKDTQQDFNGKLVPVPRGSVCASPRHIAKEVGVGHQVVRTALKRFQTAHMTITNLTHGKSVISLCNYEKYQSPENSTNTRLTHVQHTPNTQKEQGNKVTREDTDVSSGNPSPVPVDEISQAVTAYNAIAKRYGWPTVQKMNQSRRASLRARIKDAGGPTGWEVALAKAEASAFLRGERGNFLCNFDWLVKAANFTKLMEGNYDDRTSGNPSPDRSDNARTGGAHNNLMAGFAHVANQNQ